MLTQTNHAEPSNKELGIKPWPRSVMWPLMAIVSGGMWYLLFYVFA